METHPEDATTRADPWQTVSDELGDVGRRLRQAYREVGDGAPTEEQVREAFATITAAWGRVAGTVGTALGDPEVRERLRAAAGAFANALGATISGLAEELAKDAEE